VSGPLGALILCALALHASPLESIDTLYWHRHEGSKLEENIAALEALLDRAPQDSELLWRYGRALMRRGEKKSTAKARLEDYSRAESTLKRSVEVTPASAEAHYWLGVTIGRRGETQGMIKSAFLIKPIKREMQEAMRLDPALGAAHHVLGEILWQVPAFMGGDKKKALEELETAVRLSPNYSASFVPLAEAYLHFGRHADAVAILKRVDAIKTPDDPANYVDDALQAREVLARISR
jgi:tetratricopeptide (TPR) repeat protein